MLVLRNPQGYYTAIARRGNTVEHSDGIHITFAWVSQAIKYYNEALLELGQQQYIVVERITQ